MTRLWLAGLLRRQPMRIVGAAIGVAVAVALLASLGAFLAHAKASMTARAIDSVAVDWQVQVGSGADPAAVAKLVAGLPSVQGSRTVGFADVSGFSASTAGTTQTTGAGVVLGVPDGYAALFPGEIRTLAGSGSGVLLAQQTAANLHAAPGTKVTISKAGLPPTTFTVDGVVDLPQANSLFQKVGAPPGAQPSAPPDNVLLLPSRQYRSFVAPLAKNRPDLAYTQVHAKVTHALPADPAAAYTAVTGAAHNLEAASTGAATVGDNLAAALDAARGDAAYAQILFLFLGLPGAVLAGLLTATVSAASAERRRREQALLRVRGSSQRQLLRLVGSEAALIGAIGCGIGLGAATALGAIAFGSPSFGATARSAVLWAGLAVIAGLTITVAAILLPARRDVKEHTVAADMEQVVTHRSPGWSRYGIDIAALATGFVVFWAVGRGGYQLVLAPEGVPAISVSYWALAAPALLWAGAALVIWRLVDLLLRHGRRPLGRLLHPIGGDTATLVGSSISRLRRPLVRAAVLLTLAIAFAISTATFNATYAAQAEADAQLTNGADVTVTESPGSAASPSYARTLATIPGVAAVEPVQHRFAYVGSDLQDLYGVNPTSIRSATALQDSYFQLGGTAAQLMHTLDLRPDSILVSAETVKDYQLTLGDLINLRLVDGRTHQQITVPFHYVGVVAEFPTAPKDSFFVANARYVAHRTGSDAVGAFLIDTGGHNVATVADRVRNVVGQGAAVTDIAAVRGTVGSSLTAVDLAGLTRVELSFALVLAAASSGLVLGLGMAARRRSLAIMRALGAQRRHLSTVVVGEAGVVGVAGAIGGVALGVLLANVLVKVLTGVFDPPPSQIAVPWSYLGALAILTAACLVVVSAGTLRVATRNLLGVIRRF